MTAISKLRLLGRGWIQTGINCSFLTACAVCNDRQLKTVHARLPLVLIVRKDW